MILEFRVLRFEFVEIAFGRRAVIGRENDQRIAGGSLGLQRLQHLTNAPIGFHEQIRVPVEAALALKRLGRRDRRMGGGHREIEEEGGLLPRILIDVFDAFFSYFREHLFKRPSLHADPRV